MIQIGGRPRGFFVRRDAGALQIRYSHRSFETLAVGLFALAVALTVGFWAALSPSAATLAVLVLVFPVAACIAVASVAALSRETVIEVDQHRIRTRGLMLPWRRRREVPTGEVIQLESKVRHVAARWGALASVWALTRDGQRVAVGGLLFGERAAAGAAFIERQVERHLGIADRPTVCPQCGYDVRASRRRCPECGTRLRKRRRDPRLA